MKLTLTTTPAQKQLTMADLRPGDFAEIVDKENSQYLARVVRCMSINSQLVCFSLNSADYWMPLYGNTLLVRKLAPGETLTITE